MSSAGGEDNNKGNGSKGDLLEKFWSRGRRSAAAAQRNNVTDDNPVNMIRRAVESFTEEEQQKIRRHRYGGEQPAEENPTCVNAKLQKLDNELSQINASIKQPYTEAVQQEIEHAAAEEVAILVDSQKHNNNNNNRADDDEVCRDAKMTHANAVIANNISSNSSDNGNRDYVRSKNFRLMFLRAENFDARLAARRITRYFKEKKELFGMDKLSKRIVQADLSESERELLHSGFFCSIGASDTHGRIIFLFRRKLADDTPVDSFRRVVFYTSQIMEDQHEWQQKGIVVVGDGRGMSLPVPSLERRVYPFYRMCIHTLPFKLACWHVCYDDMAFNFFFRLALLIAPAKSRSILNAHYGRTEQEAFDLSEFGIGIESLPFTEELGLDRDSLTSFLDGLRQKEEAHNEPLVHWLTKQILQWL